MVPVRRVSLLDLAGRDYTWWYVAFMNAENPRGLNRFLKRGYQHVQLWRPVQYGPAIDEKFWLVVDPGFEHIDTRIDWHPMPPWEREAIDTVMRVEVAVRSKKLREFFFFGPITCVEVAKAHLGISSTWIRTPWQLAKHLRANGYSLVLR